MDEDMFRAKIYQMPRAIDDLVHHLGDQFLKHISRYEIRKRKCGPLLFHTKVALMAGRVDLAKLAMKEATRFLDFKRIPRWLVLQFVIITWPVVGGMTRRKNHETL